MRWFSCWILHQSPILSCLVDHLEAREGARLAGQHAAQRVGRDPGQRRRPGSHQGGVPATQSMLTTKWNTCLHEDTSTDAVLSILPLLLLFTLEPLKMFGSNLAGAGFTCCRIMRTGDVHIKHRQPFFRTEKRVLFLSAHCTALHAQSTSKRYMVRNGQLRLTSVWERHLRCAMNRREGEQWFETHPPIPLFLSRSFPSTR